jgi:hypothetical protein
VSDDNFEQAWVSNYVPTGKASDAIVQLKEYAYGAFDKLDLDSNGYIEKHELEAALQDEATPPREKSFITFLLNNQQAIADSVNEGSTTIKGGITRIDLEAYFKLVLSMF